MFFVFCCFLQLSSFFLKIQYRCKPVSLHSCPSSRFFSRPKCFALAKCGWNMNRNIEWLVPAILNSPTLLCKFLYQIIYLKLSQRPNYDE